MPNAKTVKLKKSAPKVSSPETHDEAEGVEAEVPKIKKSVEVDVAEEALLPEEKADDESATDGEEGELGSDEVGLDDEDVNPFGDKWEE